MQLLPGNAEQAPDLAPRITDRPRIEYGLVIPSAGAVEIIAGQVKLTPTLVGENLDHDGVLDGWAEGLARFYLLQHAADEIR